MEGYLPPAAREKIQEIQDLQADAEEVVARQNEAERKLDDAQDALEALEAVEQAATIYRSLGKIRVQTDVATITPDIEEQIDDLEARIESLENTEAELREEFERQKEDAKHLLGATTSGPGTPGSD